MLPGFPFPGRRASTRRARPSRRRKATSLRVTGTCERNSTSAGPSRAASRIDTQTYDGSDDGEQWSPRVGVLYTLSPQTQVRASVGRFVQFQGINELQVEDGVDTFYPAQHAYHAILGLDHAFAAGLDLRVEAFRKDYRHINPRFENHLRSARAAAGSGVRPRADRAGRARVRPDVEMMLRLRPHGSWSGWLSYSWSRAEDHVDGMDVPRSWDQRHAVNLGIVWSKGPWNATLTDSFHTGWPTTVLEVTGAEAGDPQIVLSRRNRARLSDYNTLDLRVTRTFALPRGALDVFVEVNNALSRANACCIKYEVTRNPDGSLNYSRDEDSWLPLVPSAGVLWRY